MDLVNSEDRESTNCGVKSVDAALSVEMKRPKNYRAYSILSIIPCFNPVGVVALFCSIMVDRTWKRGEYEK